MANRTITAANSILLIGVTGLFPNARQLKGFDEGDMYSIDPVDNAEVKMGVDGIMSSGWIPQIKTMNVVLQADSQSIDFFEAWYASEEAAMDKYLAFGIIRQPAVGRSYALTNGVLRNYAPLADAKKVLQPRKFQLNWQMILGAPI